MKASETALILIGFQNDYFREDGILTAVIEESAKTNDVLNNTLALVGEVAKTDALIIDTPIIFSEDYREMGNPVGLLKAIKELGAFRDGSPGCETLAVFETFGDRITTIPGKDGFNAFSNTELADTLKAHGIRNFVLAGAVTSICIDSTGRSAHERGFSVTVLDDCTCGRTNFEQDFYCEQILPLYADVCSSQDLLGKLD